MIIFYNKKSGQIYGTIEGRVHPEGSEKEVIRPQNVPVEEVGAYVVKYTQEYRKQIQPVNKTVLDRETMEIKTVKVAEKEIDVPAGMKMSDEHTDFFGKVENREEDIYAHKFQVDAEGNVKGIEKIQK